MQPSCLLLFILIKYNGVGRVSKSSKNIKILSERSIVSDHFLRSTHLMGKVIKSHEIFYHLSYFYDLTAILVSKMSL